MDWASNERSSCYGFGRIPPEWMFTWVVQHLHMPALVHLFLQGTAVILQGPIPQTVPPKTRNAPPQKAFSIICVTRSYNSPEDFPTVLSTIRGMSSLGIL